jgi:NAD(P)-dependent dehydrogenase (short-subunit alcohol dehydrogenase family)
MFSVSDSREGDLLGRVCLVTGATSGVGKAIARGLALKRAHLVIAARDLERGRRVAEELRDDAANPRVEAVLLDVADQRSVRDFAEHFTKRFEKLHVLVACAGVYAARRETTEDGVERTWATNVLGYYLPTVLLADTLAAGAPARIVHVSSSSASALDLDDVQFERRKYDAFAAYRASKQAGRMLTWALAGRLRARGVTANAMHPGYVRTGLIHEGAFGFFFKLGGALIARSPERGADTAVWLASSRAVEDDTAGYYADRKEKRCRFHDEERENKLWALCESMTAVRR